MVKPAGLVGAFDPTAFPTGTVAAGIAIVGDPVVGGAGVVGAVGSVGRIGPPGVGVPPVAGRTKGTVAAVPDGGRAGRAGAVEGGTAGAAGRPKGIVVAGAEGCKGRGAEGGIAWGAPVGRATGGIGAPGRAKGTVCADEGTEGGTAGAGVPGRVNGTVAACGADGGVIAVGGIGGRGALEEAGGGTGAFGAVGGKGGGTGELLIAVDLFLPIGMGTFYFAHFFSHCKLKIELYANFFAYKLDKCTQNA